MTTALAELLSSELPDLHQARREDLAAKIKALLEAQPCVRCQQRTKRKK